MKIAMIPAIGLGLIVAATGSLAAAKPAAQHTAAKHAAAKHTAAKPAPACAALVFRPLPAGTADGEQTAGTYSSRLARLELRGTVQNGAPANYYLVANGARIAAAAQTPKAAGDCALAKKMPRAGAPAASCTGERFTVVIAHAGDTHAGDTHASDKRVALLYAQNGGVWSFCNAGGF